VIKGTAQIQAALNDLNRLDRHARYSQAIALTRVAQLAQYELLNQTRKVFDNPTPFTMNSTYVRPATPTRLVAEVGFKGGTETRPHYLAAQTVGGSRTIKRFEFWLRRYGVLGQDEYVVPAKGFPLDVYGNVPRGIITAILADVQAHPDLYARSTSESRAKRSRRKLIAKRAIYFATRPGSNLPLGIYQRTRTAFGSSVRGVFMFVRGPRYKVRLPLLDIVTMVYDRHMADEYSRQLNNAFASGGVRR
jgi:hypothetical protein